MSGVVAITPLFTDLVGSTALASSVGPDEAEALRQTHFGLLRGAISGAGGTEVKNLGDGLMAVFTSPSRALACAVAMQQAIDRHNQRSEQELAIRIGLATGECTEEDGDYFGEAVVQAARLCAAAKGGQILATDLLRLMVGRHATQEFVSVGDLSLKGLPDPTPAVEVVWEPSSGDDERVPLPTRLVGVASAELFGFFGRTTELADIELAAKAAADGETRVVLISGEPGIGKTSLVARAARDAHQRGARVLYGRCEEDLAVPYQPWIEALTFLAEHAPIDDITAHVEEHGSIAARLAPPIARRVTERANAAADPETERYLLLEAVAGLLQTCSATQPIVIVLDDLHWADSATLQLLRALLASPGRLSLLVLGTYRDTDLSRHHPFTALLADLRREPRASRCALEGLDDDELVALVEAAAGHSLDDQSLELAHTLRRETGGNPFFTGELIRHLAESGSIFVGGEGRWTTRDDLDDIGLPGSVREVVARRVARLGDDATRILSLASVIGREFELELLMPVAGADEDDLIDLLDEAINAGIVAETDRAGRFQFAHALVQHTLYSDLSATRRQRAHLRVAEALEQLYGSAPDDRVGELAHHWTSATRTVDPSKAIEYARLAGDAALRALAPDEALRWFTQALELHANRLEPPDRLDCELLLAIGDALWRSGDVPAARERFTSAAAIARSLGDPTLVTRAALGFAGAGHRPWARETGTVDDALVGVLRDALAQLGPADPGLRVRLLGALAQELYYDAERYAERDALSSEALELARSLGDPTSLVFALASRHEALRRAANVHERLALADEMVATAEDVGALDLILQAHRHRLVDLMELADFASADLEAAELERLTDGARHPFIAWTLRCYYGARAMTAGRFEDCERLITEAFTIGERSVDTAFMDFAVQFGALRREQGRSGEVRADIAKILEQYPRLEAARAALAQFAAENDDVEGARHELARIAAQGFGNLPDDIAHLLGLGLAAEAAWELDDEAAALDLASALMPYRDRAVVLGQHIYLGQVAYYLGILAMTVHDAETAARELRRALIEHEAIGATPFALRTRFALAVLDASSDSTERRARAADALAHVEREAGDLGMARLAVRAQRAHARLAQDAS
ncbi:MAG TPA: AAA family ATPase [Acidimicrobiia bacterium]|nr:AAA family ATPase [Acidimicrobiia bacterium]